MVIFLCNILTSPIAISNTNLAVQGDAFFTIADSSGKVSYTRDGNFEFDAHGNLVTKSGQQVLGVYDATRNISPDSRSKLSDLGGIGGIGMLGGPAHFSSRNSAMSSIITKIIT